MSRDIDDILKNGLENQQGEAIIRVLTWTDQADYTANPNTPDHTWKSVKYKIGNTWAEATLITANDYTASDFTVFIIERGLRIEGTEYTVKSGLFFVEDYKEDYGKIFISGSSYPNKKISITGDGTYEEVIDAFASAIGKTASFKSETQNFLDYQFLETGKTLVLNKAKAFESLLRRKYTLLVYEESPGSLVFYNQDSYIVETREWQDVTWAPELEIFVAIGVSSVSTSHDGRNWTKRDTPTTTYEVDWQGITWSPDLEIFCAVGTGDDANTVMTSPDGEVWTLRTASEQCEWSAIEWSPALSLFVAVALTGNIMTSPDGTTWTNRKGEGNPITDVSWSPELAIFCATVFSSSAGCVLTSPNGVTWTERTTAATIMQAITWSSDLEIFCIVCSGGSNRVYTSPDGTTWTAETAAENNSWKDITWSPHLEIFCAISSDGTNRVMTSINGTNWISRSQAVNAYFNAIAWAPPNPRFYDSEGLFCVVSRTNPMVSSDGTNWRLETIDADINLSYKDGTSSHIIRKQSEVHFTSKDENGDTNTEGDTSKPQWNLGFLKSTASAPITRKDPYYKIYLQKAPVRLDITDSDKIHFEPFWSIDPTKTIDAMMQVVEVFDTKKSPSWYQEISSIILFDKTEGGNLPASVVNAGAYIPLNSSGFDGNLDTSVANVQALAEAVDDLPIGAVDSVNGATGTVVLDADDISDASTTNKYTSSAEISKLSGIETGAEVNPDYVSKVEAETGTSSTERIWSAIRVKQAIDARLLTQQRFYARQTNGHATLVGAGAEAVIKCDTEDKDDDGIHDPTTGKCTPTLAGTYRVLVSGALKSMSNDKGVWLGVKKNGSNSTKKWVAIASSSDNNYGGAGGAVDVYLDGDTDYVEFIIYNADSAGRYTYDTYGNAVYWSAERIDEDDICGF